MITIPEPCHEDWEKMRVVDSTRRHCASCEKTLVDFSLMSDDEIASYLRYRTNQKLCGRFSSVQLNRHIPQIPEPKMQSRWRMWLLFPLTLIGKLLNAQQDSVPPIDTTRIIATSDTALAPDSSTTSDGIVDNDSAVVAVDTIIMGDTIFDTLVTSPPQAPYIWQPAVITGYQILYCPPATMGVTSIVTGGMGIAPVPQMPFVPFDWMNVTANPDHKPKTIISSGARRPPVTPDEKPKHDSTPPPVPTMPWYAALIPIPFRRKQKEK